MRFVLPFACLLGIAACRLGTGSSLPPLDEERLRDDIAHLASDEFHGRAPGTTGEDMTVRWIRARFEEAGLVPAADGGWFQTVPLVETIAAPGGGLRVAGPAGTGLTLERGEDAVLWTRSARPAARLENSPLVFAGYGIVAPEYGWDDYRSLDVRGKTVVMLVNDPGYASGDTRLFRGRAMTLYGRWTYKFEEAGRRGARGALLVHEPGAAGYDWDVVRNSWSGPQLELRNDRRRDDRAEIEGWITTEAATALFAAAGLDFAEAAVAAGRRGFVARELGLRAGASLSSTVREFDSRNVAGQIRGGKRPHEAVLFMAHWDHLGEDPSRSGDGVYNGAVDNATGVAGLVELARTLAALRPRPERSLLFLATTAEEKGLLGSSWYARSPLHPHSDTVAAINMDGLNVLGRTRDVVVVGAGQSELDDWLARAAGAQGRRLVDEPFPEKGYFYRSDHINLARAGVPVIYAEGGLDLHDHDSGWGEARALDYLRQRYHRPGDEYDPAWDLSGAMQDLALYRDVALALANDTAFPRWRAGSEFRARRETDRPIEGGRAAER